MSYLESLKTEANYTRTLNGAKTHGSTDDACLDFFAVAGGMRYRRRSDQINLFDRAYIETPELAAKLPPEKLAPLLDALAQDPRPAYIDDAERVYGFAYAGFEVKFRVEEGKAIVTDIEVRA